MREQSPNESSRGKMLRYLREHQKSKEDESNARKKESLMSLIHSTLSKRLDDLDGSYLATCDFASLEMSVQFQLTFKYIYIIEVDVFP